MPEDSRTSRALRLWRALRPYAFAVLASALAFAVRVSLDGYLGEMPYVTFYLAVMLTATVAGWAPGLLATALCAGATPYLLPPRLSTLDAAGLAVFVVGGAIMSTVAGLYRRALVREAARQRTLALQEAEERFHAMMRAVPSMTFEADGQGNNTYCSDRWCAHTGLTPAQGAGWGWARTIHPDDAEAVAARWSRGVELGQPVESKHRVRRKDGSYGWVLLRAEPSRNEAGNIVRWAGSLTDIDDVIRTEQALRDRERELRYSEQRLTWAMQTARGGAYELDLGDGKAWWSLEMYELFGVEPGTAVDGALILSHIDPRDRGGVEGALRLCAEGAALHVQFRVHHRARGERWMETFGRPLPDGGGIPRLLGITLDITERRHAEEAIEQSEARFRQLANAMPNLAWTARPDGTIDYVNDRARDFAGLGEGPTGAWEWHSAVHPDDQARMWLRWKHALETGETYQVEFRLLRADGRWAWHLCRANALRDEHGHITKWFGSSTDIDEAKETERALRRSEDELRAAKAVAEAANAAKRDFLAHMSHEIRTPMTAIAGMTDLALAEEPAQPLREYLDTIKTSSDSVIALINNILDFSRIEAGKLSLDESAFSIRGVVEDTLKVISVPAREKGLAVTHEIAPEVPPLVLGDRLRLSQILTNLEANAVKFTDRGAIGVRVAVVARGDSHASLRFSVSDTGIGMTQEQRARVFAPYTQGDASMTRRYGGSGLGLAISQGLVELMGGRLQVQTHPGQGSTLHFTLRLPLLDSQSAESAPPPRELPTLQRHLRILLAEDSPLVQKVVEHVLTKRGHLVDTASNGQQAVDNVRSGDFDLVLMDLEMPVMDGLTATAAIRTLGEKGRIPIVAMTAHAMKGDEQRCLQAGMDAYLSKPISSRELIRVVEHLARAA